MERQINVSELIDKARVAQSAIENYSQEQVDAMVRAVGKAIYDNAALLAELTVEETQLGVVEHKIIKNTEKSMGIWNELKGKKSVGIIKEDKEKGIIYVAKPIGVVGCVSPTTNPNITPMGNAMIALKGRNALIVSAHPRAQKCTALTVKLMNDALRELGAPENLIQIISNPSIEATQDLMRLSDVVIATGGMGMVKAAYSSGKPSYGVGQGNVQVIFDENINYENAVKATIGGRMFDNGIICAGDQSFIVPESKQEMIMKIAEENGAFYVSDEEIVDKFRTVIFVDGHLNKDIIGKSPYVIGRMIDIDVPKETVVIVLKVNAKNGEDILCGEKMCPVMITQSYESFKEGVAIAKSNLMYQGAGHSAVIHTENKKHAEYAGLELPISRLLINQSGTGAGGNFGNGLEETVSLGCGTWGNNSVSGNITYEHMINITRLSYAYEDPVTPDPDIIWNT